MVYDERYAQYRALYDGAPEERWHERQKAGQASAAAPGRPVWAGEPGPVSPVRTERGQALGSRLEMSIQERGRIRVRAGNRERVR